MKFTFRRWGSVSSGWLNHPDVGLDEWAVLAYLATLMRPDGSGIEPSQADIAEQLKTSRSRINQILGRLAKIGVIEKVRRYAGCGVETSCAYRIRIDIEGIIAPVGTLVPSVLSQVRTRKKAVSRAETPVSQIETSGVAICDTNQDSKILDSPLAREGAGLDLRDPVEDQSRAGPGIAERTAKTLVDEQWVPTPFDIAWAGQHCPDLDILHHTQSYIANCRAKGFVYHDHSWAWRAWALKEWSGPKSRPAGQGRERWPASPRSTTNTPSLAECNRSAADACLERINRRRGISL